jgi:UDP-3-O-[3-hydroxymyristoyl] glucosamine N-acyltransferase
MTSFKNFLGTRSENPLRTFLRDSEYTTNLENADIQENVVIGQKYKRSSRSPIIGKNAFIRSNTVIYDDTEIGKNSKLVMEWW